MRASRTALLTACLGAALAAPLPARAVIAPAPAVVAPRAVEIEAGSGRVLHLSGPATNVFVADPKVAQVHPASASTLFVFGTGPGRTTVAALDAAGHTLGEFEVTVRPSSFAAREAEAAVARAVPGSRVVVHAGTAGLTVSGQVETPEEAAQVLAIVKGFVAGSQAVQDQLSVRAAVQVTLRVRIVEMSRSVVRELGVNWQALGSLGQFTVASALAVPTSNLLSVGSKDFNLVIDALAQDNLARVLAEPNLTVMSGQTASFLAGGEFPILVPQGLSSASVTFKNYGVQLSFVPTVLSSGRIDLRVSPEVSELSSAGAVTMPVAGGTVQVPALTVRRAQTSVELGSGQSFAIAGLLQDNITQSTNGLPFLGDLPVLGALFRSNSFQRQETELVILVTPYIVRPVSDPTALHTPGEDVRPASDLERILELRQESRGQPVVPVRIPGSAGFIAQ